jgi:hypothetical protein
VYAYIATSLWQFPDRVALRKELTHAGLTEIFSRRFYLGTLEMITVVRPLDAREPVRHG